MKQIIFISLITLMSCGKYSEIKTNKRIDSYCNNTYRVDVCVWVRDWKGSPISLEYLVYNYDVPESKVDSVIKSYMSGAVECKNKIDICLKNN